MDRFQRLLVFIPNNHPVHAVVRTADRLARDNQAEVVLMDVVGVELGRRLIRNQDTEAALRQALIDSSHKRLRRVSEQFLHVVPGIEVVSGIDFVEVIGQVFRGRHDLVLVGSHPRSSQTARLDPTLTHLLRKSPVPVWVVDESHADGDVLVALGPAFDSEGQGLNRTLLEIGSSLAKRMGVGLHLAHAWKVMGENLIAGGRGGLTVDQLRELAAEEQRSAETMLAEAIADVPAAASARTHLRRGAAEEKLLEIISEVEPAVVVMGTVARKGIAGLIVGNTAERLLLTADASLLTVKPVWFESPVPPPQELGEPSPSHLGSDFHEFRDT